MKPQDSHAELMPASIQIARVVGIPIALHYSWFIIAGLITFSLVAQFRATQNDWSTGVVWSAALVTSVLFFVTLLAHELSHAVVARARGLPVHSITLFALGGIAQIGKEATRATTEFLVAIVGPITSVIIGLSCMAVAQGLGWSAENGSTSATAAVLGWLGSINILLALFNLIPGYPLDGGRVLRALLWSFYQDVDRATRNAARVGQWVAGLFIAIGLMQFLVGASVGGLWLAFIGWFLLTAAQASYHQVNVSDTLRNIRVGDVMADECAATEPGTNLQSLVEDVLLRTGRRCIIVSSAGRVFGLVTLREVRAIDRSRWADVTAGDIMRPLDELKTVTPGTPLADAFKAMAEDDVNQLPVLDQGHLAGIISRGQILQLLQARKELRAA